MTATFQYPGDFMRLQKMNDEYRQKGEICTKKYARKNLRENDVPAH